MQPTQSPFPHVLLAGRFAPLTLGHCYLLGVAQRLAPQVTVWSAGGNGLSGRLRPGDRLIVATPASQPTVPPGTVWLSADWIRDAPLAAAWGLPLWPLDRAPQLDQPVPAFETGQTRCVVLYGPECAGKTTLAQQLAASQRGLWCSEQVRTFFDYSGNRIDADQAATVGQVQAAMIGALTAFWPRWLFCDTDPLASRMWYEHYYGPAPDRLVEAAGLAPDLTLLLEDDLPFHPDPQRRYPDRREFGTAHAEAWLQRAGRDYRRVGGQGVERLQAALAALSSLR